LEAEINIWIRRAEDTWLGPLYAHAEQLFRNQALPSHDQSHHLRVWNLCKSLLRETAVFHPRMDPSLVEGVLIAALFHDLGMAFSTREDHGRLSRENCEQWFRERTARLPERYEEILRAIELHDRKNEDIYGSFDRGRCPEILAFLSVADDLEALGTIGIYRYAEIYLLRGVPLEELGTRILDNVRKRFDRLEKACSPCPQLLKEYREEFHEICDFYEGYNHQLEHVSRPGDAGSGPLGVINHIRRQAAPGPFDAALAGKELQEFFIKLYDELEQARS
jgi:hypothetical protein